MPTSVTPVLSTKVGYLEDVRDQVKTLVRYVIMNPGFTSSLWEDQLISLRKLEAEYGNDRNSMVSHLKIQVAKLLANKFKDFNFDTSFTASDYDKDSPDGRYTITFSIMMNKKATDTSEISTEPSLLSGSIKVNKATNQITLDYERTSDSISI